MMPAVQYRQPRVSEAMVSRGVEMRSCRWLCWYRDYRVSVCSVRAWRLQKYTRQFSAVRCHAVRALDPHTQVRGVEMRSCMWLCWYRDYRVSVCSVRAWRLQKYTQQFSAVRCHAVRALDPHTQVRATCCMHEGACL
jgi:hypothetical protein